ncbi:MAG: CHC2 zinc finger domain-containing protein [Anaerolineae bacterium]|nr:CHC2 zinc finger domain-containing protein [Anaerolineae bacterium]
MPIDRETLTAYAHRLIPRFDCYSEQLATGRYRAVKESLTLDMVEAHLRGEQTLGAYALDAQSRARWICLDADDDHEWAGLLKMVQGLHEQGIHPYIEPSRRGGHLWFFFTDPLPGRDARRLGKQLLTEHNLETVELYPKQDELRTGPGSLVRLPLGIHRKSGKRYYFVTLSGEPLAPSVREQMRLLAYPVPVSPTFVEDLLSRAPEAKQVFPTPSFEHRPAAEGDALSERIKNRISVYEFVSQYVQFDRGTKGLCPFHDDHEESFSISIDGNYWHCFAGCGGGSVIDFWMKWREMRGEDSSFTASITDLAKMLF